ncbi:uncharacterized protein MYCGRDRAFT_28547, partial [Zymoseptoria tritici IPO323]
PAKRRSKLAKDNDISAEEEAEIQEAFTLFAKPDEDDPSSKDHLIATSDDNAELAELIETVDPDDAGWVGYEHFVAIAALKLRARDNDPDVVSEEVEKAYRLFTKGEDRAITLLDLKRVARELREEVPDNVLKDMIREATGGGLGGVGMEDFEGVMRRAGV